MSANREDEADNSFRKRRLTRDWQNIITAGEIDREQRFKYSKPKSVIGEIWLASTPEYTQLKYKELDFVTGSSYEGQCSSISMEGVGVYTLPHGVIYQGQIRDGMFHGKGILVYPRGQALNCIFKKGKMIDWEYLFTLPRTSLDQSSADFKRRNTGDSDELISIKRPGDLFIESYCKPPDRRFYRSYRKDFNSAPNENLTNQHITKKIPKYCYDVNDGFYNDQTKWVHSSTDKDRYLYMTLKNEREFKLKTPKDCIKFYENIPNVPVYKSEKWIKENCRKPYDVNVGYKPQLYEYWFSGREKEREKLNMKSEENGGKFVTEKSLCQEIIKSLENIGIE